jgi:PadR family transcriptional regulator PadR
MKIENAKAQMRKGVLEYCILSLTQDKDMYSSDIISSLKEAELIVVEGTLYPLLTRLKNAGLLIYRWEESKSGPPRKYYGITDSGKSFLQELNETWGNLVGAVSKITASEAPTSINDDLTKTNKKQDQND